MNCFFFDYKKVIEPTIDMSSGQTNQKLRLFNANGPVGRELGLFGDRPKLRPLESTKGCWVMTQENGNFTTRVLKFKEN
jgi:hypothetical protein